MSLDVNTQKSLITFALNVIILQEPNKDKVKQKVNLLEQCEDITVDSVMNIMSLQ